MKFTSQVQMAILAFSAGLVAALPEPVCNLGIGGYDKGDERGLIADLKDNGDCRVPANACIRVGCGNTSAIYLCNENGEDKDIDCAQPAASASDIVNACDNNGKLTNDFGITIYAAYGNCNKSPSLGPYDQ